MVLYKLTQYQPGYIVWIEWKGEWLYKYIDSDQWTLYKLNELQKADGYIRSERLYQRVTVMSGSLGSRVLSRRGDLCCQNIRPNVPNLTIKRWATNECTILFQSIDYSIGQIIQINMKYNILDVNKMSSSYPSAVFFCERFALPLLNQKQNPSNPFKLWCVFQCKTLWYQRDDTVNYKVHAGTLTEDVIAPFGQWMYKISTWFGFSKICSTGMNMFLYSVCDKQAALRS